MAEATQTGPGVSGPGSAGDSQSGTPTEQAQEKAKEVAGQAQEKAGQAADQARSKVREQVDQRSTQVGEQISSNAGDVRSVADELRKQGKDGPARAVEQAADRAERVGSWLTESDGDRILRDVEDFGRKNPWAIAAGGLVLGFAASRVLKASSGNRYQSSLDASSGVPRATGPEAARLPARVGVAGGPANGAGGP
jgi:uncharacterized protein YjbJ (UPF0337 family)